MTTVRRPVPKRRHFVPEMIQKRFVDGDGQLHAFDRRRVPADALLSLTAMMGRLAARPSMIHGSKLSSTAPHWLSITSGALVWVPRRR